MVSYTQQTDIAENAIVFNDVTASQFNDREEKYFLANASISVFRWIFSGFFLRQNPIHFSNQKITLMNLDRSFREWDQQRIIWGWVTNGFSPNFLGNFLTKFFNSDRKKFIVIICHDWSPGSISTWLTASKNYLVPVFVTRILFITITLFARNHYSQIFIWFKFCCMKLRSRVDFICLLYAFEF